MSLALDLIELTEVGGQPRKLAAEIHRQLRAAPDGLPLPVPLEHIAKAGGIVEITERETTTFEGMLVANATKTSGAVVLRKGLRRGRRNFTLGHEIGHFVTPYHRPPPSGFICDAAGLQAKRAGSTPFNGRTALERMEVEANEFSLALLIPVPEFRSERGRLGGDDLSHVQPLAKLFGTSTEVMARTYVDTSAEMIAILATRAGRLVKFFLPPRFPYLGLSKGTAVPLASVTAAAIKTEQSGRCTRMVRVSPETWLERPARSAELYEQVLPQENGWALTLLRVEEPSGADDDDEVESAWPAPRFSYGR